MSPFRILAVTANAALFLLGVPASQPQTDPLPREFGSFGSYFSKLHPGPSTLAGLTYLFQGFPESVSGVRFGYEQRASAAFELYLFRLLDSPTPAQKDLREWAVFVASRVYLDAKRKPYLVLTKNDRGRVFGEGRYMTQPSTLAHNDMLLRDALLAYWDVDRRALALSSWKVASKASDEPVTTNVHLRLKEIVVTNSIGKDWDSPQIWR